MAGLFVAAIAFAAVPVGGLLLMLSAMAVGFCLYTSINALYFLVPTSLPVEIRSTGTGFAMAAGRLGAVAGPLLAGFLMAMGLSKVGFIALLSIPMLVAAVLVYSLRTYQLPLKTLTGSELVDPLKRALQPDSNHS
ncbi:putative 3-hydroxyphenylpropionic transporter MhpT [compost metagenome]